MADIKKRQKASTDKRNHAAKQSEEHAHQRIKHYKQHQANGDESLPCKLMSFTKGLPHDEHTGLIKDDNDFQKFIDGICKGDPEIIANTPLGPNNGKHTTEKDWKSHKAKDWLHEKRKPSNLKENPKVDIVRAWESSGAGLTFDLQGPDAQTVFMKPAPKLGSTELTAEMAEVYAQAALRDLPLEDLTTDTLANQWFLALSKLDYFSNSERLNFDDSTDKAFSKSRMFRGLTNGDLEGPYLSQFMLAGNNGLGSSINPEYKASDGYINYGSTTIDQRVRNATPGNNYMTTWEEYLDVQNGADFRGLETYEAGAITRKFITTGRDLATYVHYDALYQAYLNACLFLLNTGTSFDPNVPFQGPDLEDKQQGFAHFGGPHILTLVTEVATRALKAVRYQKFNVHRRLRPEALAARMEKVDVICECGYNWNGENVLEKTFNELDTAGVFNLLSVNKLLPMAFCEGSPMHPSYGAGHATVAGACVTILKAFFDTNLYYHLDADGTTAAFKKSKPVSCRAFVPNPSGTQLEVVDSEPLTLGGELNKLAANISIGRNWGGVHFYSDYRESMRLGEEIAIGILKEQALTYNPAENFRMSLTKFDGSTIHIAPIKGINKVNTPIKKTHT